MEHKKPSVAGGGWEIGSKVVRSQIIQGLIDQIVAWTVWKAFGDFGADKYHGPGYSLKRRFWHLCREKILLETDWKEGDHKKTVAIAQANDDNSLANVEVIEMVKTVWIQNNILKIMLAVLADRLYKEEREILSFSSVDIRE